MGEGSIIFPAGCTRVIL